MQRMPLTGQQVVTELQHFKRTTALLACPLVGQRACRQAQHVDKERQLNTAARPAALTTGVHPFAEAYR